MPGPADREVEPNDSPGDATLLPLQGVAHGVWHDGDGYDYFAVTLTTPGVLSVEVAGQPAGVSIQLMALGFAGDGSSCLGFDDSAPGAPLGVDIGALPGRGVLAVQIANIAGTRSEGGRTFYRCRDGSLWHPAPPKTGDAPSGKLPASLDGVPVGPPIEYSVSTRFTAATAATTVSPGWTLRAVPLPTTVATPPTPGSPGPAPSADPVPPVVPPAPPPPRLGAAAPEDAHVARRFLDEALAGDYTQTPEMSPCLSVFSEIVAARGTPRHSSARAVSLGERTDVVSTLSFEDGSSMTIHVLLREGRVTGFHAQPDLGKEP